MATKKNRFAKYLVLADCDTQDPQGVFHTTVKSAVEDIKGLCSDIRNGYSDETHAGYPVLIKFASPAVVESVVAANIKECTILIDGKTYKV